MELSILLQGSPLREMAKMINDLGLEGYGSKRIKSSKWVLIKRISKWQSYAKLNICLCRSSRSSSIRVGHSPQLEREIWHSQDKSQQSFRSFHLLKSLILVGEPVVLISDSVQKPSCQGASGIPCGPRFLRAYFRLGDSRSFTIKLGQRPWGK